MAYRNFIKAFSKISDYFVNSPSVNPDTAKRMANSFFTYANKLRISYVYGTKFNAGDICRVELGANIEPEMSYQHMCVVLGKKGHLYYVVPITSKNPLNSFHTNAFHPTDNPSGKKNFILLKQTEYSTFLSHDSVVKCEDLKSVSEKRMTSKIDNIFAKPIYQEIRNAVMLMIFPSEQREHDRLKKEVSLYKLKLFIKELANHYLVEDFSDFTNQLLIPPHYTTNVKTHVEKSLNTYEYDLELIDEYGQTASKKITYTIK